MPQTEFLDMPMILPTRLLEFFLLLFFRLSCYIMASKGFKCSRTRL